MRDDHGNRDGLPVSLKHDNLEITNPDPQESARAIDLFPCSRNAARDSIELMQVPWPHRPVTETLGGDKPKRYELEHLRRSRGWKRPAGLLTFAMPPKPPAHEGDPPVGLYMECVVALGCCCCCCCCCFTGPWPAEQPSSSCARSPHAPLHLSLSLTPSSSGTPASSTPGTQTRL